jgi:hypothetical protein
VRLVAWHHDGSPYLVRDRRPLIDGQQLDSLRGLQYVPTISDITIANLDGTVTAAAEILFTVTPPSNLFDVLKLGGGLGYTNPSAVYIVNGRGEALAVLTPDQFGTTKTMPFIHLPPVVADVDGDRAPDVLAVLENRVGGWNPALRRPLPGWPINLEQRYGGDDIRAVPVVGDLDNDGRPEVIAVSKKRFYVWRSDGADAPTWPVPGKSARFSFISELVRVPPVLLKANGRHSIVTIVPRVNSDDPSGDGDVLVGADAFVTVMGIPFKKNTVERLPASAPSVLFGRTPPSAAGPVAVGDVDNNGTLDAVFPGGNANLNGSISLMVFLYDQDMKLIGSAFEKATSAEQVDTAPVIVRLANGRRHIYAVDKQGRLHGVRVARDSDGRAQLVPLSLPQGSLPLDLKLGTPTAQPIAVDLDRDGDVELVVKGRVSDTQVQVTVVDLGVTGTPEWGTLQRSSSRNGAASLTE